MSLKCSIILICESLACLASESRQLCSQVLQQTSLWSLILPSPVFSLSISLVKTGFRVAGCLELAESWNQNPLYRVESSTIRVQFPPYHQSSSFVYQPWVEKSQHGSWLFHFASPPPPVGSLGSARSCARKGGDDVLDVDPTRLRPSPSTDRMGGESGHQFREASPGPVTKRAELGVQTDKPRADVKPRIGNQNIGVSRFVPS